MLRKPTAEDKVAILAEAEQRLPHLLPAQNQILPQLAQRGEWITRLPPSQEKIKLHLLLRIWPTGHDRDKATGLGKVDQVGGDGHLHLVPAAPQLDRSRQTRLYLATGPVDGHHDLQLLALRLHEGQTL